MTIRAVAAGSAFDFRFLVLQFLHFQLLNYQLTQLPNLVVHCTLVVRHFVGSLPIDAGFAGALDPETQKRSDLG